MKFGDFDIPIKICKDDLAFMENENNSIGDFILHSKEKSGITVSELSQKTGISESSINRHITNKTAPDLEMIVAYCIIFRINMFQSLYLIYKAGYNLFSSDERKAYLVIIVLSYYFGLTIEQANEILKCLDVEPIKYKKQAKEGAKNEKKKKSN